MFHKEGSFNKTTQGKKSYDTPLRKSDRRKLRDRFLNSLQLPPNVLSSFSNSTTVHNDHEVKIDKATITSDNVIDSSSNDDTIENMQLIKKWLEEVFLNSNSEILIRKVKKNGCKSNAGATNFYLRTPSSSTSFPYWPYQITQPILIELPSISSTSSSFLLPTVSLLSVLLPTSSFFAMNSKVVIVPAPVSKYLCRGADLMRSGMLECPSSANNNTSNWVCVKVEQNEQPFAVGFLTTGTGRESIGAGTKGIGVKIVTCYGDDLWKSQMKMMQPDVDNLKREKETQAEHYHNGNYGNVGFVEGKLIYGLKAVDEEESDMIEGLNINEAVTNNELSRKMMAKSNVTGEDTTGERGNLRGSGDLPKTTIDNVTINGSNEDRAHDNHDNEKNSEEQVVDDNPEQNLYHAFYTSILAISPKNDLPIAVSTFYTKFLLPSRKAGILIDMKATRFKKLGNFLLDQAQRGVITIGSSTDGKDSAAFLTGIDKSHVDLREARRLRKERKNLDANGKVGETVKEKTQKMAVASLFIVPSRVVSLFRLDKEVVKATHANSEERKGTGFLTAPECREILNDYIISNELVDEFDPELVKLDAPLCEALYRNNRKTIIEYPESVTRKELNIKWLEKMENAYAIVKLPGSNIFSMKRGKPPVIQFDVESRQNRKKFVTRVRGLENYGINVANFANDASKRFACSATIDDNPTGRAALKKGCVEVSFQGHLFEELQALLTGNDKLSHHGRVKGGGYCVPNGVIESIFRKGVPKKKLR